MVITRISIQNPVFAAMMMIAIMVLGLFSYSKLGVEQMPEVTFPYVEVNTSYPGASAEIIEQEISKPLEQAVVTVRGVKGVRSTSREGQSQVGVEFSLNVDAQKAVADVRDKVAEVRRGFNRDVRDPSVSRVETDNDQPILQLSLSSEARSLRELSDIAEKTLQPRLQGVTGVGGIEVVGARGRELYVRLKPEKMAAVGVSVDQIAGAIRRENQDSPVGALEGKFEERLVRITGKLKTREDFEKLIVARRGTGPVLLRDVAEVSDGAADVTNYYRVDGKPTIGIRITKTASASTVDAARGVKKLVAQLRQALPADTQLEIDEDRSEMVQDSVDNVKATVLEGACLTIAIVFLFLRSWRSTIITGLTLPISVIGAFVALQLFGFTLNFMTLLALSLSIGMLIDDAIVVRENIVRHLHMGKTHVQAAFEATQEIGLAVMATTFSIVAVFVPIAFMGGIVGKFFYPFGVTVAAAVLISLFVSFTLDPMLSSIWKDPPSRWMVRGPIAWVMNAFEAMIEAAHRIYGRVLGWALTWPKLTLLFAALSLVAGIGIASTLGSEMVPQQDEDWQNVNITMPVGASLEYTSEKATQVYAALKKLQDVEKVSQWTWKGGTWFGLKKVPRKTRALTREDFDKQLREQLKSFTGLETKVGWNQRIRVDLLGPNIQELERLAKQLEAKMRATPGFADIENTFKPANPTLDIVVNRDLASDLGVSVAEIAATTRALVAGESAGQWQAPDGENYNIRLRLPRDERTGIADLDRIYVASYSFNADATPRMVPLRQIAELKPGVGERSIRREDLQRRLSVIASPDKGVSDGEMSKKAQALAKQLELPLGYSIKNRGAGQDLNELVSEAGKSLALSIVFIYLVLASQFGSILQPFAIMASLPLSFFGVFLSLKLFGSSINVFSIIGIITLMGLVTKNAILLVDFANQAHRNGRSLDDALHEAGQVRLRPILMTTAAMIFGMLPLAFGGGQGNEIRAPMAHAVLGGLITSTLLTLVVVPVLYRYTVWMGEWVRRWFVGPPESPTVTTPGAAAGTAD